jgi:ParB/RepB/Spo0J family partition protein
MKHQASPAQEAPLSKTSLPGDMVSPDRLLHVSLDKITIGPRARAHDPEQVKYLMLSIEDVGLINPITVIAGDTEGTYTLVAGRHRLEAYKQFAASGKEAFTTIPALITTPAKSYDVELSENLFRNDLTVLEKAEHVVAYLKGKDKINQAIQELANQTSQSERNLKRYRRIGADLQVGKEVRKLGNGLENSTTQLYFLAKQFKNVQQDIIKRLKQQPELSVWQAHALVKQGAEDSPLLHKSVFVPIPAPFRSQLKTLSQERGLKQNEFLERILGAALQAYEEKRLTID